MIKICLILIFCFKFMCKIIYTLDNDPLQLEFKINIIIVSSQ